MHELLQACLHIFGSDNHADKDDAVASISQIIGATDSQTKVNMARENKYFKTLTRVLENFYNNRKESECSGWIGAGKVIFAFEDGVNLSEIVGTSVLHSILPPGAVLLSGSITSTPGYKKTWGVYNIVAVTATDDPNITPSAAVQRFHEQLRNPTSRIHKAVQCMVQYEAEQKAKLCNDPQHHYPTIFERTMQATISWIQESIFGLVTLQRKVYMQQNLVVTMHLGCSGTSKKICIRTINAHLKAFRIAFGRPHDADESWFSQNYPKMRTSSDAVISSLLNELRADGYFMYIKGCAAFTEAGWMVSRS